MTNIIIKTVKEGFDGLISKPIRMSILINILNSEYRKKRIEKVNNTKQTGALAYGSKKSNGSLLPLEDKFPQLVSMFGDDTESIKEILLNFVETTAKDTDILAKLVNEGNLAKHNIFVTEYIHF